MREKRIYSGILCKVWCIFANNQYKQAHMKPFLIWIGLLFFFSCQSGTKPTTAQEIVDKAIEVAGGHRYQDGSISFRFRDRRYVLENNEGRTLKRISTVKGDSIVDRMGPGGFQRWVNGQLVQVPDSMAVKYSNSINSVHYFTYLPFGLNDKAVNKKLLGETTVRDKNYYKLEVTFDQEGGGKDYDDVYIYWINTETFKPDYLAYEFHVDGGGVRFREAFNERYIGGIRFVDYNNYKPETAVDVSATDSLFTLGRLKLLSRIELKDIVVTPDKHN